MSGKARDPDLPGRVRHLEELVRRLGTRRPPGGASTYRITNADLHNDGASGWFAEGYPYPAFVRQGDLVMLNGAFHFFAPAVGGIETIMVPGKIPAEFRPHILTRTFSNGFGFVDDHFWMLYIAANGSLFLAGMHNGGPLPGAAWGDVTVGTQHAIHVEATYPAASLGLGDFPP